MFSEADVPLPSRLRSPSSNFGDGLLYWYFYLFSVSFKNVKD